MFCLTTHQLKYQFSNQAIILDSINLEVPFGSIYGFLGPNGAGKTTTLKLILGLLKQQHGEILIFGKSISSNRIEVLRNIGSMIESPSVYGHLSAEENLKVLQKIYQCPLSRIQEVLKLVDLNAVGHKKVSQFSLGMKQRLSIAIALLHNPKLLILDEPTNGLDPNGIIELRTLLKYLNQTLGVTIIISSHLLAEVEKLVTHIGILSRGKLMFQGELAELIQMQQQSSCMQLDTNNNQKALPYLKRYTENTALIQNKIIIPLLDKEHISELNHYLLNEGFSIYEMSYMKPDLESIFLNLIKQ